MSSPPAVTLSHSDFVAWSPSAQLRDDRDAIEPDVLAAAQAVLELDDMQCNLS